MSARIPIWAQKSKVRTTSKDADYTFLMERLHRPGSRPHHTAGLGSRPESRLIPTGTEQIRYRQ
jgi:hypothetical protein